MLRIVPFNSSLINSIETDFDFPESMRAAFDNGQQVIGYAIMGDKDVVAVGGIHEMLARAGLFCPSMHRNGSCHWLGMLRHCLVVYWQQRVYIVCKLVFTWATQRRLGLLDGWGLKMKVLCISLGQTVATITAWQGWCNVC